MTSSARARLPPDKFLGMNSKVICSLDSKTYSRAFAECHNVSIERWRALWSFLEPALRAKRKGFGKDCWVLVDVKTGHTYRRLDGSY